MAGTTALTLAVSLGVLYLITVLAGQPVTVAMLGVVISMISSTAFDDPDVRQRELTAGLMLLLAAAAVTLGAYLAPYELPGDGVFVAIMIAATYARRYGKRGTMLGMVGFMTYFFALFLGAQPSMLGWLILALAIGTLISFGMRTFVLRDHPDRQLERALRALGARVGGVVELVGDSVAGGGLNDHRVRQLQRRVIGVGETALMVETQLDDVDLRDLWPGVDPDELRLRLFDVELATEHLAGAGRRAAAGQRGSDSARDELVRALRDLRRELRAGKRTGSLSQAGERADRVRADPTAGPAVRVLALATSDLVRVVCRTRARDDRLAPNGDESESSPSAGGALEASAPSESPAAGDSAAVDEADGSWIGRLEPSARQAIQVGIASSLAIVAGELLSSARWYWAVIAAFVTFSGTSSRGETLTKGWQRVLGTIVGVGFGVVVATIVDGNTVASIALIFLCMFAGFYLMKVAYGLMIFWISTMLALLYGLLGEFSVGLLLTRIEETAIGAAIGILVACLVLPTSTRETVDGNLRGFLTELAELVGLAGDRLGGEPIEELTSQARQLDRTFTELRNNAKPLTTGVAGVHRRSRVRRAVNVMGACDEYARGLARVSAAAPTAALSDQLRRSAQQVQANIVTLAGIRDGRRQAPLESADRQLDAAYETIDGDPPAGAEHRRLAAAVGYLRQLDLAVVTLADELTHEITNADP